MSRKLHVLILSSVLNWKTSFALILCFVIATIVVTML